MAERTRGSGSQHNGGSKYVAERSHSQTLWHRATNYPGTHGYLCFLRNGCGGFGSPGGMVPFFCLFWPRNRKQGTRGKKLPGHTPHHSVYFFFSPTPGVTHNRNSI